MWVVLLCMASQDDKKSGVLPFFSEARLVALSGLNYDDMECMYGMKRNETLETFCNMGIVSWLDSTTLHVTNYHKKQTQQSTSSEMVATWRAKKNGIGIVPRDVTDETNVTLQSNGRVDKSRVDKNRIDNKESSRFAPPSLEEISDYCLERKNRIDASQFIDFYASKGWLIGKNKMKDWKAAVRTWENRDKSESVGFTKIS